MLLGLCAGSAPGGLAAVGMMKETRAQAHDYTKRYRGHDYVYEPRNGGLEAHMMGWGKGLALGDYLLLANPQAGRGYSRYQITALTYQRDPCDMWIADVVYAPEGAQSAP